MLWPKHWRDLYWYFLRGSEVLCFVHWWWLPLPRWTRKVWSGWRTQRFVCLLHLLIVEKVFSCLMPSWTQRIWFLQGIVLKFAAMKIPKKHVIQELRDMQNHALCSQKVAALVLMEKSNARGTTIRLDIARKYVVTNQSKKHVFQYLLGKRIRVLWSSMVVARALMEK